MIKKQRLYFLACAGILLGLAAGALGQSAAELLDQAIYAEETEGDLDKAVRLYEQVIATGGGDDVYVARALYRKGMCHLKAGQSELAEETLAKLLDDFAGQEQIIARARQVMAGFRMVDPARLMPPDTVAYAEIGSPGRQLERLLGILSGTPLENQLTMMMEQRAEAIPEGLPAGSPPMILARLLNPSMINEFKKIQGLAAGAQQPLIPGETPILVVLYPGESDALKGILHALIGGALRPAGEVAGLRVYGAEGAAFAAYNEDVILVSNMMDILRFAASQYQNHHPAASLADSQDFFSRVPMADRRDRLLTAWVDADGIYDRLTSMMGDDIPPQLLAMNAVGGLEDLKEIHLTGGLEEDGIRVGVEAEFAEGHHAMIYDLIRTPNGLGADLQGVPDNAAAVLSFRLGDATAAAVAALRQPLRRWTGLDLGRELFANIEQVAVSIVPPEDPRTFDPAGVIAVAITSQQPAHSRALIHGLFSPLDHILSGGGTPLGAAMPDRESVSYLVGESGGRPQHLHVGLQGRTTLISLNPALVRAAQPGPLSGIHAAMRALPPTTSKALAINAGGLIRTQAAMMRRGNWDPDSSTQQVNQLAELLSGTHLILHTEEEENRLAIHADLGPIAGLNQVLGLVLNARGARAVTSVSGVRDAHPMVKLDHAGGTARLEWTPQGQAAGTVVRFGPSKDELGVLAEVSPSTTTAVAEGLKPDTTYYWQVERRSEDGAVTPGEVWSFDTAGMKAHYTFDAVEDETMIRDRTRHGHHGIAGGGARVLPELQGRTGVLDLNGVSSYVEIPRSVGHDFTIALWVRTDHEGNHGSDWWQGRGLVDGEMVGTFNDFGTSVLDGRFVFGTGEPGPAYESETSVWSEKRIDDGVWHQVVAVRVAETGEQTVYVDGKRSGTVTGSIGPKSDPPGLRIGSILSGVEGTYFEGQIDEVRLYNYPLDAEAVEALYRETAQRSTGT